MTRQGSTHSAMEYGFSHLNMQARAQPSQAHSEFRIIMLPTERVRSEVYDGRLESLQSRPGVLRVSGRDRHSTKDEEERTTLRNF